jgi:hemerythrin HHE cation binding domain-containing protein
MKADTLFEFMQNDHARLNALYGRVLEALEANAPDLRQLWTELDHGLLAHMEAEERFMLPAFARVDRHEAVELLREHGVIREQLLELGIAVDLHYIRLEQSRDFIATLRSHAEREDRLLYRWADERLDAALVAATRGHISR